MLEVSRNTCRALLQDGHTRCAIPLLLSTYSCDAHSAAYNASYERYKEAERKADRLSKSARMRHVDIQHLRFHEIEPCLNRVRAYVHALAEERRLRRKHDTQFIGAPDAGHRQRLEKLETKIAHYRSILQALRTHRRQSQHNNTHTLVPRRRYLARGLSRTASPAPRVVQRRTGPKPEEERRASARAEARQELEEERERQHLVVVEGERKRQQRVLAEEAFRSDLETAIFLSRLAQYEKDAHRAEGEEERSQGTAEVVDGSTQEELSEESPMDTAGHRLEECPPEDWPREVGSGVDASGDDAASDSTSNASLNDVQSPIQQLHEPLGISIYVDDDWSLPNSTSDSSIEVEETNALSTGIIIKGEVAAGSDDSGFASLDSEPQEESLAVASALDTTWTDNLSSSQSAPEAVSLEVANFVRVTDDSDAQAPLDGAPGGATYNQGFPDTPIEGDDLVGRRSQSGGGKGRPRGGEHGRGRRYLQYLLFAASQVVALIVLRKMYRMKSVGKLWKLFKRIAYVGARRISN